MAVILLEPGLYFTHRTYVMNKVTFSEETISFFLCAFITSTTASTDQLRLPFATLPPLPPRETSCLLPFHKREQSGVESWMLEVISGATRFYMCWSPRLHISCMCCREKKINFCLS